MKLSEIDFRDLYTGMKVISAIGTKGKIVKFGPSQEDWLVILWNSGYTSVHPWHHDQYTPG